MVGDLAGDAALGHALVQARPQALHALAAALRAHRLAQLVGLSRREPGDVDRHLHELLLEQRHAERLVQRALEQRVQVGHRLGAVAPPDVGMHRPALDRPGADERDLDDEVVEGAGLEPRQRRHLRPALDLEHADRVGAAQHVVDRVVLGDGGEVDLVRRGGGGRSRSRSAAPTASRGRAGRTSRGRRPRSRPCPTAARCGPPCVPTRPGTPRSPAGRRCTMPPEWMPRWRGKCSTSAASSSTAGGMSCDRGRESWPRAAPTRRPASTTRLAGRSSSRAPWPCRAPTTSPGR